MKKLVLDFGHGATNSEGVYDPGACGNGLQEADLVLDIGERVQAKLAPYDVDVQICPRSDSLKERADFANNLGADFFCSIHIDAGGGTGFESYVYSGASGTTRQLQDIIHNEIMAYLAPLGVADRGRKQANYAVLRLTKMSAILLENLFVDNTQDATRLKDDTFLDGHSNAIAWALVVALGLQLKQKQPEQPMEQAGTIATGQPAATLAQAREFLQQVAPDWALMADLYYSIGPKYNIRPDVALCQACKETGYFRFGGAVTADKNNFCGLKVVTAAGDTPADHATFADRATGVEAHVQHLAAYFTMDPIANLVDPRFEVVAKVHGRGKLKYVEDLGGKWAPNKQYGESIVHDYLDKLLAVVVPAADPAPDPCSGCVKVRELQEQLNRYRQAVDIVTAALEKVKGAG